MIASGMRDEVSTKLPSFSKLYKYSLMRRGGGSHWVTATGISRPNVGLLLCSSITFLQNTTPHFFVKHFVCVFIYSRSAGIDVF